MHDSSLATCSLNHHLRFSSTATMAGYRNEESVFLKLVLTGQQPRYWEVGNDEDPLWWSKVGGGRSSYNSFCKAVQDFVACEDPEIDLRTGTATAEDLDVHDSISIQSVKRLLQNQALPKQSKKRRDVVSPARPTDALPTRLTAASLASAIVANWDKFEEDPDVDFECEADPDAEPFVTVIVQ